ncbi:endonuclease VII [Streptomyces phage RosePharie]|nr:endonuclease VII [Streptomyces phage RosePharie]
MARPCHECGGPKPAGRGRKYCNDCTKSCADHAGYTYGCAACQKSWLDATGKRKVYRERYADDQSRKKKMKAYGLTEEQLDAVLEPGKCYTCDSTEDLVIDHDHATGVVRGLLCNSCNVALGHVKDSIETLQRMIEYLEISQRNDIKEIA